MKKIIFPVLLALFAQAIAETCPSLSDIQTNQLGKWCAFDADNGVPLSVAQLRAYEAKVKIFESAAYYEGAPEGPAQCYYSGVSGHYDLNVYLARHELFPDLAKGDWRDKHWGHYECNGSLESCGFIRK